MGKLDTVFNITFLFLSSTYLTAASAVAPITAIVLCYVCIIVINT